MLTELLKKALIDNQHLLSNEKISQLVTYLELLNKWNKTHNLTAIKNPEEQVYKHLIDSLSVAVEISGESILDVGTGPGLPGIPLSIYFPEKKFVLVDCSLKRVNFLKHVIRSLKLKNTSAFHQRIEQSLPNDFSSSSHNFDSGFEIIISRAFSSIESFINTSGHLLAPNGKLIAMKGVYPNEELTQIPQDFCIESVRELTIIGLQAERHCVNIIKKQTQTKLS